MAARLDPKVVREAYNGLLLQIAGETKKYVEGTVQSGPQAGEPTGKMVIHDLSSGNGRFATGVVIGVVTIGGVQYEVRSREVASLHPVKKTVAKTSGSAF